MEWNGYYLDTENQLNKIKIKGHGEQKRAPESPEPPEFWHASIFDAVALTKSILIAKLSYRVNNSK